MKKRPFIILEQWRKREYQNRLVSDGYSIWMEFLPRYAFEGEEWRVETMNPDFWLKIFTHK